MTSALQSINFGAICNQHIEIVALPSRRHSITFGENFNNGIDNMTLPDQRSIQLPDACIASLLTMHSSRGMECEDAKRVAKHQLRRNLQPESGYCGAAEPTA